MMTVANGKGWSGVRLTTMPLGRPAIRIGGGIEIGGGGLPNGYAVLTIGGDPVVDADGNVYIVREALLQ